MTKTQGMVGEIKKGSSAPRGKYKMNRTGIFGSSAKGAQKRRAILWGVGGE